VNVHILVHISGLNAVAEKKRISSFCSLLIVLTDQETPDHHHHDEGRRRPALLFSLSIVSPALSHETSLITVFPLLVLISAG
jgi:hypothetical protein